MIDFLFVCAINTGRVNNVAVSRVKRHVYLPLSAEPEKF